MKRKQVGGLINRTGYLKGAGTNKNPVNIIPSAHITTEGMIGPISANGIVLHPDTGDYHFDTPYVIEKKLQKGGHTITTPRYLSTYPNDENTLQPMKKSLRGKQSGGRHFDPQLGNYMSNIYANGGLIPLGYPYRGYNDNERGGFSGIMMGYGGNTPEIRGDWMDMIYNNTDYQDGGPFKLKIKGIGNPFLQGFGQQGQQQVGPMPGFESYSAQQDINTGQMYNSKMQATDQFGNVAPMKSGGSHWIQHAINPAHKGYCTPMSKPTCTGHRRALALMFKKKHGFHKHEDGGYLQGMEMQQGGQMYMPYPSPAPQGSTDSLQARIEYLKQDPDRIKSTFRGIRDQALKNGHDYNFGASTSMAELESLMASKEDLWNTQQRLHQLQVPPQILNLPPDVKAPRKKKGGYQLGGSSFTPAGSLIDQNQWAIGTGATPTAPMTGNYYKTDPSQQTPMGVSFNRSQGTRNTVTSFGTPNIRNLSMLLPLNAGLGALSQANQYNQNQAYRTNNMNNPLSLLGRDDGRPDDVRYGYQTFQAGGATPIPVSNPNDPRLKAYQDSLSNYNWSNSNGRNKGLNTLFPDDVSRLRTQSDYRNWSFTNNNTKEQPQYYVYDAVGKPEGNGAGAPRDYYAQYPDPQQPYVYKKPLPELKRSQVQQAGSIPQSMAQIGVPTGGPGPLAGGPTNFSFTGRDDQGQQTTRYFSGLDTWRAATDQMGYRWRSETGNGTSGTASGYQFRGGGETMPFAGVPLHLWQMGGAAKKLRPYMLRQGSFQDGGSLLDQWDIEDAQDQAAPEQQQIPEEENTSNQQVQKRADLSNDEEYATALQIASQGSSFDYTPYQSRLTDEDFEGTSGVSPITSTSVPTVPSSNRQAYKYLLGKGLSPIAASGVVGNLMQESDLKPTAQDGTGAFGAAQWMGARLRGLNQFALSSGRNSGELSTQLDYLVQEAKDRGDLQRLTNATTPEEAATIFGRSYERPAERTANWARRQREARNVYQP